MNKKTNHSLINIGTGIEKSILDYAKFIMRHLGVDLKIKHKNVKLDGTFRKLMDSSLAKKYGWRYKTDLEKGIALTINDYFKKKVFNKC